MKSFCEQIVCMFRLIKGSDVSCVMTDCFEVSRRKILNFHISGSKKRKKVFEMGKCTVV